MLTSQPSLLASSITQRERIVNTNHLRRPANQSAASATNFSIIIGPNQMVITFDFSQADLRAEKCNLSEERKACVELERHSG